MDYDIARTRLIEVLREAFPDRTDMVKTSALETLETMASRLGLSSTLAAYLQTQFQVSHLTELPAPQAEQALEFIERLASMTPERHAGPPPFPLSRGAVVKGTCLWISGEFTMPEPEAP